MITQVKYPCAIVILLLMHNSLFAQVLLAPPLGGTPGQDYWIVNYVDHDTSPALLDYACGNKTYDGHEGTDLVLRSFKTMDSGVAVYAMADGIVFKTKDSLFDRSKKKNSLGLGNYVAINHSNEYYAYYAHLKKFSLMVKVGDTVKEGQVIGMVGSSGNSTDPHLHVEIYDINSMIVDPYWGPCQPTLVGAWKNQPAYDTTLKVIDMGLTPYVPHLDTLRERYDAYRTNFTPVADTAVNFWIQLQGIRQGDTQRVDWYDTSGALYFTYTYITPQDYWYYFYWSYINVPPLHSAGKNYTVKYYINNAQYAQMNFSVPFAGNIISNTTASKKLIISPNPANNVVYISGNKNRGQKLLLYNSTGSLLDEYPPGTLKVSIDNLPLGAYYLHMGTEVNRFIKL